MGLDRGGHRLGARHLLHLTTMAGADALGLADVVDDFLVGKEFDALWLSPTAGLHARRRSPPRRLARRRPGEGVRPRRSRGRRGVLGGRRAGTVRGVSNTPDEHDVDTRAELLPEEEAAGSDDPRAQAEQILEESAERVNGDQDEDSATD